MEKMCDGAKWIWPCKTAEADEYGEFYLPFSYKGGRLTVNISCDSNYALYLNGALAAFGQYADYPQDKVYDCVDITDRAREGENHLAVIVWYYGIESTSVYCKGEAALWLTLCKDGVPFMNSDETVQSRLSRAYENHREKQITGQLGLSFAYDLSAEDGWMTGALCGFSDSFVRETDILPRLRPCKRPETAPLCLGRRVARERETGLLFDLGREEVGLLSFSIRSPRKQRIRVAYGEHIADGGVRRCIGDRDFSVEITLREGENRYQNPFRRLAGRYLEILSAEDITVEEIGLVPVYYPLTEQKAPKMTERQARIYAACVRTLRLCMHEHYEDCPWREQAMYCMDSRNQMLAGYYAFGETAFPRACLSLIAGDRRSDDLLSICYPCSLPLAIPSFSLHYFTECAEYLAHTGDRSLIAEVYPKLKRIMAAFLSRMQNGLVPPFTDPADRSAQYWNFYEWEEGLDGTSPSSTPELSLNALLSLALRHMGEMARALQEEDEYTPRIAPLNEAIRRAFWRAESGSFADRADGDRGSVLGNSLAILTGAAEGESAMRLCRLLTEEGDRLTPISLSMQCFYYDALLTTDREKYAPYVLSRIEKTYLPMTDGGSGTVWETAVGAEDFSGAGSLCHGWSAMPVYYYHLLLQ